MTWIDTIGMSLIDLEKVRLQGEGSVYTTIQKVVSSDFLRSFEAFRAQNLQASIDYDQARISISLVVGFLPR